MLSPALFARRPSEALLAAARQGLAEAAGVATAGERYALAHLAALRAAAAVLAARARPASPGGRRSRPISVWVLVSAVAPELGEWAAFFAAGATKRAAAEAGVTSAVTDREADDLLRDAVTFLALVETTLGRQSQWALPLPSRPLPASTSRSDPDPTELTARTVAQDVARRRTG